MTKRPPTVAERRRHLSHIAAASGVSADRVRARLDFLVAGLVREWHVAVAVMLVALGYALTWEGAAAAVEALATGVESATGPRDAGRVLAVIDEILTTATLTAVRLADASPLPLVVGTYYRLPNDDVVMACGMGRGWWRLQGGHGDYLVRPDGAIVHAPAPGARRRPERAPVPTDWLVQDLCTATEADFRPPA
jgi:hypothetical protein